MGVDVKAERVGRYLGGDQTVARGLNPALLPIPGLAEHAIGFKSLPEAIELRNRVERMGELFDWSALACHYDEAHSMALERVGLSAAADLRPRELSGGMAQRAARRFANRRANGAYDHGCHYS